MKIRAHHLLCLHTISGDEDGYSKEFIDNMIRIAETIRNNPDTMIEVTKKSDDICAACPNDDEGTCTLTPGVNIWIGKHDGRVLDLTGLKEGQTIKAKEVFQLVKSKVSSDMLAEVCKGCPWLETGCAEEYEKGVLVS